MPEEILRFDNVWCTHDLERDHVDNISFSLRRGEGLLISGPEGSGKSLILDLVIGKRRPHFGQIWFEGQPLETSYDEEKLESLRFSIGYVAQNPGLINNLSLLENIILPLRYHTLLEEDELVAAADIWIERYELAHKKHQRPVALTYSEMVRTALIRALVVEPRLLLLDNITDAMCPLAARRILELLFEDIRLRGITHIITSYHPLVFAGHDLQFMLLYRGEVVFQGKLGDIQNSENNFVIQYCNYHTHGPMRAFNPVA